MMGIFKGKTEIRTKFVVTRKNVPICFNKVKGNVSFLDDLSSISTSEVSRKPFRLQSLRRKHQKLATSLVGILQNMHAVNASPSKK